MTSRNSSGSSCVDSAVEPTKSQNITVSCRRSASGAVAGGLTGIGRLTASDVCPEVSALLRLLLGTGFLLASKGVPHSEQNLAVGCICWPQLGQSRTNGVPHSEQNFTPSAFSVLQLVHCMPLPLPLHLAQDNLEA